MAEEKKPTDEQPASPSHPPNHELADADLNAVAGGISAPTRKWPRGPGD